MSLKDRNTKQRETRAEMPQEDRNNYNSKRREARAAMSLKDRNTKQREARA
jgi:hypothetical protein